MGIGASLTLIAIGAILAFALRVDLSGIDINMIGWILILVGLVGMAFTMMYTRPRRGAPVAEVLDEEPVYMVRQDEPAAETTEQPGAAFGEPAESDASQHVPPHVHPAPEAPPESSQPGSQGPAVPEQQAAPRQPARQAAARRRPWR